MKSQKTPVLATSSSAATPEDANNDTHTPPTTAENKLRGRGGELKHNTFPKSANRHDLLSKYQNISYFQRIVEIFSSNLLLCTICGLIFLFFVGSLIKFGCLNKKKNDKGN